MEVVAYVLLIGAFGFGCWCLGVYMGAQNAVARIVEEMNK
jgi:hypothetical protein